MSACVIADCVAYCCQLQEKGYSKRRLEAAKGFAFCVLRFESAAESLRGFLFKGITQNSKLKTQNSKRPPAFAWAYSYSRDFFAAVFLVGRLAVFTGGCTTVAVPFLLGAPEGAAIFGASA